MEQVKNNKSGFLSDLLRSRSTFIEILFVGIIIGLSIEFLGSNLGEYFKLTVLQKIWTGIILLILATGFLLLRLFGNRQRSALMEGFFAYDSNSNEVLSIPRYEYGEYLVRKLNAAFAENQALSQLWQRESLRKLFPLREENPGRPTTAPAITLIREATEYFILDRLSTHLSGYFELRNLSEKRLRTITRKDIPDVLLSNRFLELFSKPMEERPNFVNQTFDHDVQNVVYSLGRDGTIYNRFDLILPKDCKITRSKNSEILIDSGRFSIKFVVLFDGFNTVLPRNFEEYYLKRSLMDLSNYLVQIKVDVRFKFASLLSPSSWDYYWWIDSFLNELNKEFSADSFFQDIGWEHSVTVIETLWQEGSQTSLQAGGESEGGPTAT